MEWKIISVDDDVNAACLRTPVRAEHSVPVADVEHHSSIGAAAYLFVCSCRCRQFTSSRWEATIVTPSMSLSSRRDRLGADAKVITPSPAEAAEGHFDQDVRPPMVPVAESAHRR